MDGEGRITERGDSGELVPWNPDASTSLLTLPQVRYSRGFLRADPVGWFETISAHWLPLFHALGAEANLVSVRAGLEFPDNLDRVVPIEIDGEIGVIGLDAQSQSTIVDAIASSATSAGSEIALEYIERRFLSTLSMSWSGSSPLLCYYAPPEASGEVEVIGTVSITLEISGRPCTLWVGIGAKVLERLDLFWRERVTLSLGEGDELEETSTVRVILAELAVPPAMLIDYMRSGTVIDLEVPVSDEVYIYVGGQEWAQGRLQQFNSRFAVEIISTDLPRRRFPENTTRVQVQIAEAELDQIAIAEHAQPGAILLTRTPVASTASMFISGENIASAVVGQIHGHFALNVLPK